MTPQAEPSLLRETAITAALSAVMGLLLMSRRLFIVIRRGTSFAARPVIEDGKEPEYWLSTLPESITFRRLVDFAKLRWRIERDYQELKQEVGLGHFEGRGWRGFHHHATMCIAAYGFLISERETIPPSGPRSAALLPQPTLPHSYRPRGSSLAA